MIDQNIGKNYL